MTTAALLLAGCVPLPLRPRPAPEVSEGDVIEIRRDMWSMSGEYGTRLDVVTEDSYTTRYEVPGGEVVHDVTVPLDAEHRSRIETATEDYVAWEAGLNEEERPFCTDTPAYGIRVTGTVEHSSSMIDCAGDENPLTVLLDAVGDARADVVGELADPFDRWTIEVRPEGAPPRTYTTDHEPARPGVTLTGPTGSSTLAWSDAAAVLHAINDVLTDPDAGCADPVGEIDLAQSEGTEFSRTVPICTDGAAAVLVETLQGA